MSPVKTPKRGFDLLAPHYRWMERLLAGSILHACRTRHLPAIAGSRKILLLGEGPGRFLYEVIRSSPHAEITCLDSSGGMLTEARHALRDAPQEKARVNFVQADVFDHELAAASYDAVATHFFLDCFPPDQLQALVSRIARALAPGGAWLLSDFRLPAHGPRRWRAAILLNAMYLFFRAATGISARHLTNPDPYLEQCDLTLVERHTANWEMVHADLWRKGAC